VPLLKQEPFVSPADLLEALEPPAGPGRWWALHTRPRAEKSLARKFLDRGVSFFLPVYEREWRNQGRQFRSFLPLFPGYVFLFAGDEGRVQALETNLVANVLPVDNQPRLHADLARVHRLITTGATLTPEERIEPGDPVTITFGPLAGLEGKVLGRGKHSKFFVEVQFLRRAVSVEIDSRMIESLRPVESQCG
jgi:transcription antitermination factor NusG